MKKEWYLGLDIGTASVGWAATDPNYKVIRKSKRKLMGVELFDEAQTAAERRLARGSRRRLDRRQWRQGLLRGLMADEINKVDSEFLLRLEESKYHLEDKKVNAKYVLFNDVNYTDVHFNKQYPTIYHLRESLKTEKNPDIRKVYLALQHMMKSRGHFLLEGLNLEGGSLEVALKELLELMGIENIDIKTLKDICLSKDKVNDKVKALKGLGDKKFVAAFKVVVGGSANLSDIFGVEEYKELDSSVKSISFKNKVFDEVRFEYEAVLGSDIAMLDAMKLVFDCIILEGVSHNGMSVSAAKVYSYEKHKADIKRLKKLVMEQTQFSRKERQGIIDSIFKDSEKKKRSASTGDDNQDKKDAAKEKTQGNYVRYTSNSKVFKGCDYNGFVAFLKEKIKDFNDSPLKKAIEEDMALGTFLPLQRVKDNAVIPYQLHREEMLAILDNASKYNAFFTEEVKEKIVKIFEFKIPYYVGPLHKDSKHGWLVRNVGYENHRIDPYNFKEVVNESKTAEAFIENLVGTCTYLEKELVIPKESLLYSEFMVLNELNNIRLNNVKIAPEVRNIIIEELYLKEKMTVTKAKIKKLLLDKGIIDKDVEITGVETILKASLKSRLDFMGILGDKFNEEHVEQMIYWLTVFGGTKKLIRERIETTFKGIYTDEEISKIVKLSYKDWSKLSKKLLTEIVSSDFVDFETGEKLNIIGILRRNTINLMEIMSKRYDIARQIDDINAKYIGDVTEVSYELVRNLATSPSVKRSIWQAIKVVEKLKKLIGCEPTKIFIETTKTNQAPKKETDSRHKALKEVYSKLKQKDFDRFGIDVEEMKAMLEDETPSTLRNRKVFAFYKQLGYCMYTMGRIDRSELSKSKVANPVWSIEHIHPQSKVKDDSIDNLILVRTDKNIQRGNVYPLPESYRTNENKAFWGILKDNKLISSKTYSRLVRDTEFNDDELCGFIERQLVETSQSIKLVAKLLEKINKNSRVIYSKAENVDMFKQKYGIIKNVGDSTADKEETIVKVRELNDIHHAVDAYLNIVVGNVYDVRFTRNPLNFVRKNKGYSLNKLFHYDVKGAWVVGETIKVVDKEINHKFIQVNRRATAKKGELYKATIAKASVAKHGVYHPIKTKDGRLLDVTKYGGYTSMSIAYFTLVGYKLNTKKGVEDHTYLVPVQLIKVDKLKTDADLIEYAMGVIPCRAEKGESISDCKILKSRLSNGSKVVIDGVPVYLGGKTDNNVVYRSAYQIWFDLETMKYLKLLYRYLGWSKVNQTDVVWGNITLDNNIRLYETILEKMQHAKLNKINSSKFNELQDPKYLRMFKGLECKEQVKILLELVKLLTDKLTPSSANLSGINFKVSQKRQSLLDFSKV